MGRRVADRKLNVETKEEVMSQLYMKRVESTLQIWGFGTITDTNVHYMFSLVTGVPAWAAQLLLQNLSERFCKAMIETRRKAYNKGWRDAKAHARKEDLFSCTLEV
jgi:hypothetical protein